METVRNRPIVVSTWNFGRAANAAAWNILLAHGSALDAVEAGARSAEDDPSVDSVGYGGLPDASGKVTLDASIMDGNGDCGSVMGLAHIRNAVSVARRVMERTSHLALVGDGAYRFAISNGFKRENVLSPGAAKAFRARAKEQGRVRSRPDDTSGPGVTSGRDVTASHDTIGILARDEEGRLAGACTTSGLAYKLPGRVGDSPIIGAGLFVDGEVGAACATGRGEEILRIVGSHVVVEEMRRGADPAEACRVAVERIVGRSEAHARTFQAAFLALRVDGEVGAYATGGEGDPFVFALRDGSRDIIITPASYFSR